jgi:transposase InsO family protein
MNGGGTLLRLPSARIARRTGIVTRHFAAPELRSWPTRARARTATVHWLEAVYNRQRRHSAIDVLSPVDYEDHFWNRRAAA